jgi:hypothetical protein
VFELIGEAVLVERETVAFNHDHPYELDTKRFAAAVGQSVKDGKQDVLNKQRPLLVLRCA